MRGQGAFDPAELKALLEPLDLGRTLKAPALDAYIHFYQLDHAATCPGVEHRIGWVSSGDFQVAVQAFMLPELGQCAVTVFPLCKRTSARNRLYRLIKVPGNSSIAER